jgi:hypothetical protein
MTRETMQPNAIAARRKYRSAGMLMRKITMLMTTNNAPATPPPYALAGST